MKISKTNVFAIIVLFICIALFSVFIFREYDCIRFTAKSGMRAPSGATLISNIREESPDGDAFEGWLFENWNGRSVGIANNQAFVFSGWASVSASNALGAIAARFSIVPVGNPVWAQMITGKGANGSQMTILTISTDTNNYVSIEISRPDND